MSTNLSDDEAQVHFALDIDAADFPRVAFFKQIIQSVGMGRVLQRVVGLETYRLYLCLVLQ